MATTPLFASNATLSGLLDSATRHLSSNWCSDTLHHLLCLLDIRFHPNAKLSITERNVLVATSDNDCFELLPFYTMLGKLGTSKLMRLYTCRGVGTRIIVPDPCPVLKKWCFVPLETGAKKVGLGFRVGGFPPDRDLEPGKWWRSTAITGIDSEGVVSTFNGTLYRLEGPCHPEPINELPEDHPLKLPLRKAMGSIPDEGSWLKEGSMHKVMQALSLSFQEAEKLKRAKAAAPKAASPPDHHHNASLTNIANKRAASPAKVQAKKVKRAKAAAPKAASPPDLHYKASLTKIAKKRAASPAKVQAKQIQKHPC